MLIDIYGGKGHAKVIIEIIEKIGFKVNKIIDDNSKTVSLFEYRISHFHDFSDNLCLAIGDNYTRKSLSTRLVTGNFPILVHPKSTISKRAKIDEGTVVMAGVTINSEVQIGKHCIINTNASIDHECFIADYVHISPNAALAGNVEVGEGTHIGIGACIIQGIKIGKWCTIGAGTVVIRDIPDGATVVGNPGRIVKN